MDPKLRVWVVFGKRLKFGSGRAHLLRSIDKHGSLRQAAAESGSSVSRTPVASSMALAMAAGAGTIGGSPTPRAPKGPCGDGFSTMIVSMFGRSAEVSFR